MKATYWNRIKDVFCLLQNKFDLSYLVAEVASSVIDLVVGDSVSRLSRLAWMCTWPPAQWFR